MRIPALLLSLSLFVCTLAFADEKTITTDTSVGTVAVSNLRYSTVDDAVDSISKTLKDLRADGFGSIVKAIGLDPTVEPFKSKLEANKAESDRLMDFLGKFITVDSCRAPRIGDSIQRVGFMPRFQNGFMFIDVTLVHTSKGWLVVQYNFITNNNLKDLFKSIPEIYFRK